jgi:hypothetical protein
MTDGLRTGLFWISIGAGAIGLFAGLVALILAAVHRRSDNTSAPRAVAVAIMFFATAALTAGVAKLWPHQPL